MYYNGRTSHMMMHRHSGRALKRTRHGITVSANRRHYVSAPSTVATGTGTNIFGTCTFAPARGQMRSFNPRPKVAPLTQISKLSSLSTTVRRNYCLKRTGSSCRCFATAGASRNESFDDAIAALPANAQLQFDFFGEPVTFLGLSEGDNTTNAMAALDAFVLAISTKGRTCTGGGEEEGVEMKAAHSSAIAWAELLRHAKVWNPTLTGSNSEGKDEDKATSQESEPIRDKSEAQNLAEDVQTEENTNTEETTRSKQQSTSFAKPSSNKFAPMLVIVAVAPILAQAGVGYVRYLDTLLEQSDSLVPGMGPLQMLPLAQAVIQRAKDSSIVNDRERLHIKALECMMQYDYQTALVMYHKILRTCPGDIFALSMAMDLANVLGDKEMAFRAASSVAQYWTERQGGFLTPSIPGYNIACSWQALGMAVGGRKEEAEQIAERTLNKAKRNCGGVVTWALAHIFDAEGRVAEGISYLANSDGIVNYEGCGLIFFDCRLSGYGALFSIDREQRGRGRSAALRLYERNFQRVLDYSGFSRGKAWTKPGRRAPMAWVQRDNDAENSKTATFFNKMLGRGKDQGDKTDNETQIVVRDSLPPSLDYETWDPSCEDVLTWLPPTPPLLTEATLLLFRLTLNGTVSTKDARWEALRNAWNTTLEIQKEERSSTNPTLKHFPLASLSASILLPIEKSGGNKIGNSRMATGLYKIGELLKLGDLAMHNEEEKSTDLQVVIADREPDFWLPATEDLQKEWKEVVDHLSSALDGFGSNYPDSNDVDEKADRSRRFQSWDFDARPIVEHAICYAACRSGDTESLSIARAICSQGVTLRKMSPEEWWRYSIILGLLGDQIASEDALSNSANIGSGQGQRG